MSNEDIRQLQYLEQSLHSILVQKQQFQSQLLEVESALVELSKTDKAYKIVGNIMVSSNVPELKKDLEMKKELFSNRLKTFEKQEQKVKEDAEAIQKKILQDKK
jgi:prefoldin beta subunit